MPSNIESPQDTFFLKNKRGISLNLDEPVVMGILNVTPDSFFDGGKFQTEEMVISQTRKMIKEGAAIIDVGGYSSRPGAEDIPIQEEMGRVLPIIETIRENFSDIFISIDTFRSEVAKAAYDAGADIVNDVSGGEMDSTMYETVATLNAPYVLMHMKGTPQNMQEKPEYEDVVTEVKSYFSSKIDQLNALGCKNIILDLGFGFGKTIEHNYTLLQRMHEFQEFNLPILTGISRKSMITKTLNISPVEALNGTTVLNTIALTKGTKILRVHDVKEATESINLVAKIEGK